MANDQQIIFFWSLLAPVTFYYICISMAHLVAPPSPSWRHHAKVGTAAFVLRVFSKISLKISPETSVKWDSIRPTELTIKIKRLEKPIKIFDFFFPQFWRRPPHIFRSGHDLISQQGVVPEDHRRTQTIPG